MKVKQYEEKSSTYHCDFVRHPPASNIQTKAMKNIQLLKQFEEARQKRRESVVGTPDFYWTTPSYGQIKNTVKPAFDVYLKEPKEIIGCLPEPNLNIPTSNIEEMAEIHREVIRTRPRVISVPSQIIADDGDDEERKLHAKYIYYSEHHPGHTVPDSVYHPDVNIEIPKHAFKAPKFSKESDTMPKIKPSLKKGFARMDADKERWLEFTDPNYNKKNTRTEEEDDSSFDKKWVEDLKKYHTHNIARKKYRNYTLGYTGCIPSARLDVLSSRYKTLDPMLSYYEAVESRKDTQTLRTDPEIKEKMDSIPLDKLRISRGITYIPVDAYYDRNISNVS